MNPALLMELLSAAKMVIDNVPALQKEYGAIKAAGAATKEELDQLKTLIEEMDQARRQSWAEADSALTQAEQG